MLEPNLGKQRGLWNVLLGEYDEATPGAVLVCRLAGWGI